MDEQKLTDVEQVVLELIDGMGGDAHSAHLGEIIRRQYRPIPERGPLRAVRPRASVPVRHRFTTL